jgi:hypothetical protein
MGDEKLDGTSNREKQIPPLRCGMTNKKTGNDKNKRTGNNKGKDKCGGYSPSTSSGSE